MRISEKQIYTLILMGIASVVLAIGDTILRIYAPFFILVFPLFLITIFFLTRYAEFRWIYIGLAVLLYGLCSVLPLSGAVVFFIILMIVELIITQFVYKFSFIQFIVIIFVIGSAVPLWYQLTPLLFGRHEWLYVPFSLSDTMVQFIVPTIVVTGIGSLLLYPLFAAYENKHRLYIQSYGG